MSWIVFGLARNLSKQDPMKMEDFDRLELDEMKFIYTVLLSDEILMSIKIIDISFKPITW